MTPKKTPTTADLASDIRELSNMIAPIAQDVVMLKNWKIAEDAAKAAVASYRKDELQQLATRRWTQLLKDLLPLIVALTVLAYAIAGHFGVK